MEISQQKYSLPPASNFIYLKREIHNFGLGYKKAHDTWLLAKKGSTTTLFLKLRYNPLERTFPAFLFDLDT